MTTITLLDHAQAAELLGCTPATVEDRLRDGTLPGVQFGRSWRIPVDALAERLRELALEQASQRRRATPEAQAPASALPRLVASSEVTPPRPRRKAPPKLVRPDAAST